MRRTIAAVTVGLALLLVGGGPGLALAAPDDAGAPTTGGAGLSIGLDYLGAGATVTLPGQDYAYPLTVSVPPGTAPTVLRGTVALPPWVTGGTVDVRQGERLISRTAVPTAPNAAIALPLTGLRVDERTNSANLTLQSYLRTDGFCQFDPAQAFRFTDTRIEFAGRPAGVRTVGDFLPPVLTKLTLYVPSDPREAEGAAAVDVAAAVVARYQNVPVQIVTRSLPRTALRPPVATSPFERQIVIAEDLTAGLAVVDDRYLTLGGPDLSRTAAFLTSDLSSLAMAAAAVPGPGVAAPQLPRAVTTLADLDVTDQQVTTTGWPSLSIGIDQTRIGRPVKDVRIQLRGTYTPPPSGSGGRVVVRAGDTVVDSWPTEAHGGFDTWVTLPDAVNRFTDVTVTVERGDSGTLCGDAHRTSLSLSADGLVESTPADPPVPPGFGSLPQTLLPRTQLAWTTGDLADIRRAVQIVTGLQRMSATPLGIDTVAVSALNPKLPAVLIAADGEGLGDLPLPVKRTGQGEITVNYVGGGPAVTNIPQVPFGSLQVVRQNDRTVLVATSTGAPELLDTALTWLDDDQNRWSALDGTALLQTADQQPVLAVPPTIAHEADRGLSTGAWIGIGAAVAVAALVSSALILRRRGRRPAPGDADAGP